MFRTGYKRRLEEDDMYEVLAEDGSERLGQQLKGYRGFQNQYKTVTTFSLDLVVWSPNSWYQQLEHEFQVS